MREPRAFTEDELRRLFAVAGRRLPTYLVLLYTGQRKEEVRSLVWGDLHLDEVQPYVLVRESTTKDKDKRAVLLHRDLAALLREMRPADATPTTSVCFGRVPTYESLRADLERAGIPHTDEFGRVVHFHAFRKTWQTLGVRYGINQRAAQEVLGHSDRSRTHRTGVYRRRGTRIAFRDREVALDFGVRKKHTNRHTKIRKTGSFGVTPCH